MQPIQNTPTLQTDRLILRRFAEEDLDALFLLYSDEEVNTFLPWFPIRSMEEMRTFYQERYATAYAQPQGYRYAICLKEDNLPIGYIHVAIDASHDFGYALRKEFWHRGIVTEAGRAVIEQLCRDGVPYITATHDRNNPRSGGVMKRLGMHYRYSYEEDWQPKGIPVIFRMYQLNLDGDANRVYRAYWESATIRFVESEL